MTDLQRASADHQPILSDRAKDMVVDKTPPPADRADQDCRSPPGNIKTPTVVRRLVPAASPLAYRPELEAAVPELTINY